MGQHTVKQVVHCTRGWEDAELQSDPICQQACDCCVSPEEGAPSSNLHPGMHGLVLALTLGKLLDLSVHVSSSIARTHELPHVKCSELCLARGKSYVRISCCDYIIGEWAESPYLKAYLGWACQSLAFGGVGALGCWVWWLSSHFFPKDAFQTLNFPRVQLLILKAADLGISGAFFIWNRMGWLGPRTPQVGWYDSIFRILPELSL